MTPRANLPGRTGRLAIRHVGPGLAAVLLVWFCAPALWSAACLNLTNIALARSLAGGSGVSHSSPVPCSGATQPARLAFARAQVAFFTGDHTAALEQYTQALAFGEVSAIVHARLAELYAERGDTTAALDHWRAAGAASFFFEQGLVLRHRSNWTGAEQALRRAVTLDPTNADMARALGEFYWEWGKHDAADGAFGRALELETSPYLRALLQGWRLEIRGSYPEAAQYFRQALALDPSRPEAYRRLADVLAASGESATALGILTQGTQHSALPYGLYLQLGELLSARGDFAGAEQAFARAERYDALSDDAWRLRGKNALAGGQPEAALHYFERALLLEPDNADTHYELGRVLLRLGQCARAQAELERAAEIAPKEARYRPEQNPLSACP